MPDQVRHDRLLIQLLFVYVIYCRNNMEEIYKVFGSVFFIAQKWQNLADNEIYPKINLTIKQWMLIVILERLFEDYPPTIMQAAEAYGTSRQNLKRMALDMQKNKFIMIVQDPDDKRIQRLVLTGKHKKHFEGEFNFNWQKEFISNFFIGLEEAEIIELNDTLNKLVKRINEIS
jgi:DNA-binding MarR family transcriptional regulator